MTETRIPAEVSGDRTPDGKFAPGNPGKPKGARHRATLAVEALIEGSAESLSQKAVDMALAGDTTALKLCLDRIAPPRKDSPVRFDLPDLQGPTGVLKGFEAVLSEISAGHVTPAEGTALVAFLEGYRRACETSDIEQRLAALERGAKH